MAYLRGHPPTVPWDILAREYIDCVEAGQHPGKTLRERYGINEKAWEHKRIHMSHDGWLPFGLPGRLYAAAWVREAREMLSARIRERARQVREHDEALRAHQEARAAAQPAQRAARAAAARAERAAKLAELAALAPAAARERLAERLSEPAPRQRRPVEDSSQRTVLDVFF